MKLTRIDRSQAQPDTARKGYFDGEVKTLQLVGPKQSNEIELLARASSVQVGVARE